MIQAEVKGIEQLQAILNDLAEKGVSRAAAKGIRAGLKVLQQAMIAAAPVGTPGRKNSKGQPIIPGGLKRNIGSRFLRGRKKGFQTAKVGLNVGRGALSEEERDEMRAEYMAETAEGGLNILRAYHGHLVALGTNPRWAGIKYGYDAKTYYGRRKLRGKGRLKLRGAKTYNEAKNKMTGKPVKYRGVMPADAFIRRATVSAESQAVAVLQSTMRAALEAEMKKAKAT